MIRAVLAGCFIAAMWCLSVAVAYQIGGGDVRKHTTVHRIEFSEGGPYIDGIAKGAWSSMGKDLRRTENEHQVWYIANDNGE